MSRSQPPSRFATGGVCSGAGGVSNRDRPEPAKPEEKPRNPRIRAKAPPGSNPKKMNMAIDVRTFRERFEQMLNDTGIDKLITLIDDLDRCIPERVIENLEAIKLFLQRVGTASSSAPIRGSWNTRSGFDTRNGLWVERDDEPIDWLRTTSKRSSKSRIGLPRLSSSEIETYMVLLFAPST